MRVRVFLYPRLEINGYDLAMTTKIYRPDRKRKRTPLRSIRELADEFGVSIATLSGRLSNSKIDAPKPVLMHKGPGVTTNTYYVPREMREWWSLVNDSAAGYGLS